jgi:hypothetical protein
VTILLRRARGDLFLGDYTIWRGLPTPRRARRAYTQPRLSSMTDTC